MKNQKQASTQDVPDVAAERKRIVDLLAAIREHWCKVNGMDSLSVSALDRIAEVIADGSYVLAASPQPAPQPVQTSKRCEPCRSTGLIHCANPDECGGPWTETAHQPIHPDDMAVDRFAAFMKAKLADARNKGRAGWQECSQTELSRMLREHVEKGDPLDVSNFAMFLWSLGYGIVAQPAPRRAREQPTDIPRPSLDPRAMWISHYE